jgi:hypothetical protein
MFARWNRKYLTVAVIGLVLFGLGTIAWVIGAVGENNCSSIYVYCSSADLLGDLLLVLFGVMLVFTGVAILTWARRKSLQIRAAPSVFSPPVLSQPPPLAFYSAQPAALSPSPGQPPLSYQPGSPPTVGSWPVPPPPPPPSVTPSATPGCAMCGRPTTYIPQYARYYCYPCGRYA